MEDGGVSCACLGEHVKLPVPIEMLKTFFQLWKPKPASKGRIREMLLLSHPNPSQCLPALKRAQSVDKLSN